MGIVRQATEEHAPDEVVALICVAASKGKTHVVYGGVGENLTEKQKGWLKSNGYKLKCSDQDWVDFTTGRQGQYERIEISWLCHLLNE